MSKITKKQLHNGWHCHDTEIIKMKKELRELKQSVLRLEKLTDEKLLDEPQLKQLDQSIFDGLDEKWRFAAVDKCGEVWCSTHKTQPSVSGTHLSPEPNADSMQAEGYYDASNWQNSLIEREDKKLTGSDLTRKMLEGGATEIDCYVSSSSDSRAVGNKYTRAVTGHSDGWFRTDGLLYRYAVPVPKGKELTGSDLCRAMLERGDKAVLCAVRDYEEQSPKYEAIISVKNNGICESNSTYWAYATPINNQGEPLTAADVGL